MNFRHAYTALLVQLPPVVVGVVGMLAGFLAGGLPALKLHPLGLAAEAVDEGVRWGGVAGGAAAIAVGLVAIVGLRWTRAGDRTRRAGAGALALCAPFGAAGVWLGAWFGPVLAGASASEARAVLAASWWHAWPTLAASLALAVAIALIARPEEAPPG